MKEFSRLIALIGEQSFEKLKNSTIAIVGLGGVGGYVAEGLARSGVSRFVLVDDDVVKASNINRQLVATHSTIGCYKVDLWKERILDINPTAQVVIYNQRYSEQNPIDFSGATYVVDAIDSIACKVELIARCSEQQIPIISCMGTGAKINAEFKIADIYQTQYDPIARRLRKQLKTRGVKALKVVYCEEKSAALCVDEDGKYVPSTICYAPALAGMLIVKQVVNDIIK